MKIACERHFQVGFNTSCDKCVDMDDVLKCTNCGDDVTYHKNEELCNRCYSDEVFGNKFGK